MPNTNANKRTSTATEAAVSTSTGSTVASAKQKAVNNKKSRTTLVTKTENAVINRPTKKKPACPKLDADCITHVATFLDRTTLNNMLLASKAVKKSTENLDLVQWPWPQTLPKHMDDREGACMEGVLLSPDGNRVAFRCAVGDGNAVRIMILDERFGKLSFRKTVDESETVQGKERSEGNALSSKMATDKIEEFCWDGLRIFSPDGRFLVASCQGKI